MLNLALCYVTLDTYIYLVIYLFIYLLPPAGEACYLWQVVKDVGFGSDARGQKYSVEVTIMETQTYPQPHGARHTPRIPACPAAQTLSHSWTVI